MTTAERLRRQRIVDAVIGSQELEGGTVSPEIRTILTAFVEGRISADDLQHSANEQRNGTAAT